jgi:hypothetical protein
VYLQHPMERLALLGKHEFSLRFGWHSWMLSPSDEDHASP